MRDVGIDRIMTVDPVTIGPEESIAEARRLLQSNGINHLPVVQSGKLAGVVSASDVLHRLFLDDDPGVLASIPVRGFMQPHPQVLPIDATLRDAADKLSTGAFHSLPVVDADRMLVGIVTSSDLIRHLLQHIPVGDGTLRAVATIEQAAAGEALPDDAARALEWLSQRNRDLGAVVEAAERYIRSGHAEHEHSVLIKRLAAIRDRDTPLML